MTLTAPRTVPVFAGLLLACLPLGCNRAAAPEPEKALPATVKWEGPLQSALEEWTELVGATTPLPDRVARVSSPVEARVRTVLTGADGKPVAEGQQVAKGTVLVQLDDTIIKSNLAKLEAGQDVLKEELIQAQYPVDLATTELDRLQKLRDGDVKRPGVSSVPLVSPVEQERANIALKDALSKLQGARGRQTAGTKEVDALKEQLRLYALTAPIGGRVGRVLVVSGQTLAVGTPVAEVVDLEEEIDVLCFVPQGVVRRLKVGQEARSGPVEKDPSSTQVEAAGKVAYIADQAEAETGNFAVKVRFTNKTVRLRSNRVLRIRVLTQPGRECLSLPEAAVMEDEDPPSVIIVENVKVGKNADDKEETTATARRLQVELGVRDRTLHQVEILRLIDPEKDPAKKWQGELKDAQFVVEGGQGLQTGDAVKLDAGDD